MSTKKITAGDILRVGDLTNDHLGAVIEVGPVRGVTYRLQLDRVVHDGSGHAALQAAGMGVKYAHRLYAVRIITPPPVVQPDEPTAFGQCIRIEGDDDWLGCVADPQSGIYRIWDTGGDWFSWDAVLSRAGTRQIIVSDPPRWPDETPDVPERIETCEEWDALDADALRDWTWTDATGSPFGPVPAGGWSYAWLDMEATCKGWTRPARSGFPVTRRGCVK